MVINNKSGIQKLSKTTALLYAIFSFPEHSRVHGVHPADLKRVDLELVVKIYQNKKKVFDKQTINIKDPKTQTL